MLKALKYALLAAALIALTPAGAGRDARRHAGDRQADRRPHFARPRRGLRAFGHRGPRQRLRPHHAVRADGHEQLVPGVAESVDSQRRRQDLHLQDPRRPDLRFGQSGHRRRRRVVAAARDQAREDPGVPALPARLDQGQRRPDGHGAGRRRPSWSRSASTSRPPSSMRCSARSSARSSTARWRWSTRPMATWAMAGSRPTRPARAPTSSGRGRPMSRSSSKPTRTTAAAPPSLKRVVIRHIPEASAQRLALEKGDVDIAQNLTPDQIAGHRRQRRHQGHDDPAGAALLHRPQREDEGTAATRRSARPCAISSTTTAWRTRSSRAPRRSTSRSGPRASGPRYNENPYTLRSGEGQGAARRGRLSERLHARPRRAELRALRQHGAVGPVDVRAGRRHGEHRLLRDGADAHQVPRARAPGADGLLGPGLHGPAHQRRRLRHQHRQHRRGNRRQAAGLAQQLGDRRSSTPRPRPPPRRATRPPASRRISTCRRRCSTRAPYIIMFQSISQRADRANVKGFVQGSSADVTYYNLTTK